ncbi:Gal102 UDP-glucose-4-epimerase [Candida orthopsilosis Co 90-125]|uniref:Gal102 UDP-glucose-4-epimerase n=1 Tax=Candida orthopsilosis (strain 90-125) TaxID=1136231 RepID=H8X1P1_CANO9|nr:Gal102 UDP-glucose-4-epimerase [Candida orthopsilosis Co 90-125]CCG22446.1 Gal102 UDP-glucose-4-epimerase [Candida orthopsilosis Co 90-125]
MTNYTRCVLVSGGAGFIGGNFLSRAVQHYPDYCFICVDVLNYASNYEMLRPLERLENFKFIKLDLSEDVNQLIQIAQEYRVTDIINFAAESSVDRSFLSPIFFTKNNIFATQNLLECYRLLPEQIQTFIHISTDEVYGDEVERATESSPLNPTNPYSATKAATDLILNAYTKSYKLPVTILRPNNIYGPGQYPEKLIPLVIECGEKNRPVPIHGDGKNGRRYLYISDFLDAMDIVWHKSECAGQVYNVGGDVQHEQPIDNNSLVGLVNDVFGYSVDIVYVKDRNYNDLDYSMDTSKLRKLGWRQKITLREGLKAMRVDKDKCSY